MPKRKVSHSEESEFDEGGEAEAKLTSSGSENAPQSKKAEKQNQSDKAVKSKKNKKLKSKDTTEATDSVNESSSSEGIKIRTNNEGEKYVDLGKKKRATLRSFKGIPLLDIREFYGPDGDEKPGKKGISLAPEQWETLRGASSTIDQLFRELKKK